MENSRAAAMFAIPGVAAELAAQAVREETGEEESSDTAPPEKMDVEIELLVLGSGFW